MTGASFERRLVLIGFVLLPFGLLLPVDYSAGILTAASGLEFLLEKAAEGSLAGTLFAAAALTLPVTLALGRRNPAAAAAVAAIALLGTVLYFRRGPMADGTPRLGVPFLFSSAFLLTMGWTRAALRPPAPAGDDLEP